jgi:sporulation protein YlmC with PRC-barrel domain
LVSLLVSVDNLLTKKLIGTDGYIVGEVRGLEADTSNWQITHLQVKLTDQATEMMGFKRLFRKSATVCIPISYVSAIGDIVTVNKSASELKNGKDIKECKS